MTTKKDIAIVGPGRVGQALGQLARRAGWSVTAVAGRDKQRASQAAWTIGGHVRVCPPAEAARAGGLVLLTVPDDAISTVCKQLADAGAFAAGTIVAHCSGALNSEVLSPARTQCGCAIGSMHPLQTFPTSAAAVDRLPGAYFFCEGDAQARDVLERLAADIGGKPVGIDPAGKATYHTAAVMACNHLVALLDAATRLAEEAGIDRRTYLDAAAPLIRATVENVIEMGAPAALTGPVARGDADTLRRHVDVLGDLPKELGRFYRAAAVWTIGLAQRNKSIDEQTAARLRAVLEELP